MRFPALNPTRLDVYKSTRIARPQRPFSGGRGTSDGESTLLQVIREVPFYSENGGADQFNFRTQLTVNGGQVIAPETDFPIAITLLLGANKILQANGEDVRIVINSVTLLDYEIEVVDMATGELVVWAKMPTLDDGDIVEVYYGNDTVADAQNKAGLWSAYQYVYHMNQDPTVGVVDSGPFTGGNAVPLGTGTLASTAGKIGKAVNFDGSSWLKTPDSQAWEDLTDASTFSLWMKAPPATTFSLYINKGGINQAYLLFSEDAAGGGDTNWRIRAASGSKTASAAVDVRDSTWHLLVGTWDDITLRLYLDGTEVATFLYTGNFLSTISGLAMGSDATGFVPLTGDIDEIQYVRQTKTPQWIETQYNNQNNFGAFFTTSAEEALIILLEILPTTIPNTILEVV